MQQNTGNTNPSSSEEETSKLFKTTLVKSFTAVSYLIWVSKLKEH